MSEPEVHQRAITVLGSGHRAPLGLRVLGPLLEPVTKRRLRVQILTTVATLVANLTGVVLDVTLVAFVLPGRPLFTADLRIVNFVYVPVYVVVAFAIGVYIGTTRTVRRLRWLSEGTRPSVRDLRNTLATPWRLSLMQAALWLVGAVILSTLYGLIDPELIVRVGLTTAITGLVVCAHSYVLTEFALRPVAAAVLEAGPSRRRFSAGVAVRSVVSWLLGSGLPQAGILAVAVFVLVVRDVSADRLAVAVIVIGLISINAGFGLTVMTVLSTIGPIRAVRAALREVERGNLAVAVAVYDGTELGELQSGFNTMVAGLRERERVRELFSQHVGQDVAQAAIRATPHLGGEEVDVAVLFVDIIGSTELAADHEATEVVALLNRFFTVVVEEVDRHGGFVNKFEGDAALAIFGAPREVDDPAGSALAAARAMAERLSLEVPECRAGIGVAAGPAVAGYVGAHDRFEFTVIGDPVNEAARLCELAKGYSPALIASDRALQRSSGDEQRRWRLDDDVQLRGRRARTRLALPV